MANRTPCVKDYVIFDLETTGLSPERDEIIEISGLRVRDCRVTEEFSTLINPGRPIPFTATRINGITNEMVQNAPSPADALNRFLTFMGDDILIGHNIYSFDLRFLQNGAERIFGKTIKNDYVDTLSMARRCLPALPRHRLTDLAEHFGITTEGAHRALNDCIMNQLCYERMKELWETQYAGRRSGAKQAVSSSDSACPKCGSPLIKRKGRFGEFLGCGSFPNCRYTQNI